MRDASTVPPEKDQKFERRSTAATNPAPARSVRPINGSEAEPDLVGACIVAAAAMIGDAAGANAEHCMGRGQTQATEAKSGESMVTILVKGTNWEGGRPEVIKNLLENVAWHLTRHFREGIHATIKVVNHQLGPQILLRIRGQTTYTVLLDTSDMYWGAVQLSVRA